MRMDRIAAAPAVSNIAAAPAVSKIAAAPAVSKIAAAPAVSSIAAAPAASSTVAAPASHRRIDWRAVALLLLGIAVLLRSGDYGNPVSGDDEQFYLLVGDRLLHGALPYFDIWDRKPFGLFALFAAIRLLPGDGVLAAQLVATLFAAATALIVTLIAHRRVPLIPALLGGAFYLLVIGTMGGGTTQTAIFYNPLIALAAWLSLATRPALDGRGDFARVLGAMLLAGLAIQIKTNAVFEGGTIGVWLAIRLVRSSSWRRAAPQIALLAMLGALPTLLIALGYATYGHFEGWWHANIISQLLKDGGHGRVSIGRLPSTLMTLAPLFAVATMGLARGPRDERFTLLTAWTVVAVIDAFAIGNFWVFYALPLAVPGAILSAEVFANSRWTNWAFVALAAYPVVDEIGFSRINTGPARAAAELTVAAIPADVTTRCLLIYEAPVIYYHLKQACLVTPYLFVDQLRSSTEAHALPDDATVALRRALAKRPGTILTVDGSAWTERNRANDALLGSVLRAAYRPVARLPMHRWASDRETTIVWRRRDLGPSDG